MGVQWYFVTQFYLSATWNIASQLPVIKGSGACANNLNFRGLRKSFSKTLTPLPLPTKAIQSFPILTKAKKFTIVRVVWPGSCWGPGRRVLSLNQTRLYSTLAL